MHRFGRRTTRGDASARLRLELDTLRQLSVVTGVYRFQNASTAFMRRRFSVVT